MSNKNTDKELSMDELKDVSGGLRGQGSSGDTVKTGDGTDLIGKDKESFSELSDISRNLREKGKKKEDFVSNPYPSLGGMD